MNRMRLYNKSFKDNLNNFFTCIFFQLCLIVFIFFIIIYSNIGNKNMLFDNYNNFINFKLKEISNKNQFRQLKITKRGKKEFRRK